MGKGHNVKIHDLGHPNFKMLATLSSVIKSNTGGGRFTYIVAADNTIHLSTTNHDVLATHLGMKKRGMRHAGSLMLNGDKGTHHPTTGTYQLSEAPKKLRLAIENGFNEELVKYGVKPVLFDLGVRAETNRIIENSRAERSKTETTIERERMRQASRKAGKPKRISNRTGKKSPPKM